MKTILSHSEEDTGACAAEIAGTVEPGAVFALRGDLGAGKSVFARAFARALGVEGPIPSPTFTIVQEYDIRENPAGVARVNHVDLYRLDDSSAALAFGLDEHLEDPDAVTLLEWPERIEDILPDYTTNIVIRRLHNGDREISVDV